MKTTAMAEAVARDADELLAHFDQGTWQPDTLEQQLAEGLARMHWTPEGFRAVLRHLPEPHSGRLIDVLAPAALVLESPGLPGIEAAVLSLRRLIDALAADS